MEAVRRPRNKNISISAFNKVASAYNKGKESDIELDEVDEEIVTHILSLSEDKEHDGTDSERNIDDELRGHNV